MVGIPGRAPEHSSPLVISPSEYDLLQDSITVTYLVIISQTAENGLFLHAKL